MLSWLFLDNTYTSGFTPGLYPGYTPLRQPTEPNPYFEQRLHSLELACAGLWELLKAKNGYTDEELIEVIKQVDQKRPAAQGTVGAPAAACPKCGHKMLTHNHTKCLWCGADVPANPF